MRSQGCTIIVVLTIRWEEQPSRGGVLQTKPQEALEEELQGGTSMRLIEEPQEALQ